MLTEVRSQALIAALVTIGSFAVVLVYALRNQPIPEGVMTLITALTTGVGGFFFGSRGSVIGQQSAHETITTTANAMSQVMAAETAPPGTTASPAAPPPPGR
jgi:FtsH-binding integral membrane protein